MTLVAEKDIWKMNERKGLKPCPFCGKKEGDINGPIFGRWPVPGKAYFVRCTNCSVLMDQDREDKVIGMWNTRSQENGI